MTISSWLMAILTLFTVWVVMILAWKLGKKYAKSQQPTQKEHTFFVFEDKIISKDKNEAIEGVVRYCFGDKTSTISWQEAYKHWQVLYPASTAGTEQFDTGVPKWLTRILSLAYSDKDYEKLLQYMKERGITSGWDNQTTP